MAWELWKEVLCLGRQKDPKSGQWYEIKPADINDALRNCGQLLSRGYPVPTVWEHQDVEAVDPADWKARYAKYTFGRINGQRINDRGNLELLHVGDDPKDRDQLLKTRFVSPKLYRGYSDPAGGEYRGATIAHVAATPTPVQFWQKPFELSRDDALFLSYARSDMADDKDDKGGEKKDSEKKGGGAATLADVIQALRDTGMNVPDEVTDEAGLVIAIKAGGGPGDDDMDLDATGQDATAPAGGAPMLMSTTDTTLEPETRRQLAGWERTERREIKTRIKDAFTSGRLNRPEAMSLLRRAESVEMSFHRETGDAVHPLNARLKEIEDRAEWSQWSKDGKRPVQAEEAKELSKVDPPDQLQGDEARDKARAEAAKDQEERAKKYIPAVASA